MRFPTALLLGLLCGLGCATPHPPQPPPTIPPPALTPPPSPLPPEPQLETFLPNDPQLRAAILTYQRTGKAPTLRRAGSLMVPFLDQPLTIRCQQLLVTDMELEPGEHVTTPLLGDSERWKVTSSTSGADTPHVLIKPTSDESLKTNVVLTTDRRTYRLTLVGNVGSPHTHVQFYYPHDTLQRFADARAAHAMAVERQQRATQQQEQEQETVSVPRNMHYRVRGPDVSWKPTSVFDDGTRVFLLMPPGFRTTTAPVLYAVRNGAEEQLNYTIRDSYFVVENLFEEAVLLTDVGSNQRRVTIERE